MKRVLPIAVSTNLTPFAWESNLKTLTAALEAASEFAQNPDNWSFARPCVKDASFDDSESPHTMVVFPELCLASVGCDDWFSSQEVQARSLELLKKLIPKTKNMTAFFGLPLKNDEGVLYKAIASVHNGQLLEFHGARRVGFQGLNYQRRWFTPHKGTSGGPFYFPKPSPFPEREDVPFNFGPYLFDSAIIDMVEPENLTLLSPRQLNVILCPGAIPFELGGQARLRQYLERMARRLGSMIVFANYLGNESGEFLYDGGSMIVTPTETAQGKRFSYDSFTLTTMADSVKHLPPWETSDQLPYEEFARATSLGMFDYLRKSKGQGLTLSLSGGADSAALAVLTRLMLDFGRAWPGFWKNLAAIKPFAELAANATGTTDLLMKSMLTTVYQGTQNSSEITRKAAAEVARAVGACHYEFNIDSFVNAYVKIVSDQLGRPLTWQNDDLALQNIQARSRAPGAWLLANVTRSILLTTGNRSESSVGYATMDGDTCGGLAPLSGIDKAFLRRWLRWMELEGPEGLAPIPALSYINEQQPTAELRPTTEHQTDESDLMPYVILNLFEEAVVAEKLDRTAAIAWVEQRQGTVDAAFDHEQLTAWYDRFWRMWRASQWKRQRSAPSFHLDRYNLSPNSDCRFPILSGD